MARRTYGQALQQAFRDRDEGRISEREFVRCKARLLTRSKCDLGALMPLLGLPKLPPIAAMLCDAVVPASRRLWFWPE